jgi:hypothetical protein
MKKYDKALKAADKKMRQIFSEQSVAAFRQSVKKEMDAWVEAINTDLEEKLKPKIIHINKNIIQQNAKNGRQDPVCRVQIGNKIRYCMEVEIKGPSKLVYRPDKPLTCGAKLWIETMADVELIGEKK